MNEELMISLSPKMSGDDERYKALNNKLEEKKTEIKHNSFLDPLNMKSYTQLNAIPPLGFSSVSRIGKG